MDKQKIDPTAPVREAPPEIKKIIIEVLKLERDRLYEDRPRLNSEIINIIKDAVQ